VEVDKEVYPNTDNKDNNKTEEVKVSTKEASPTKINKELKTIDPINNPNPDNPPKKLTNPLPNKPELRPKTLMDL